MEDREKVIEGLKKVWDAFNGMEHELYADYVFDTLELLKEQDYRGWLMDMFHKYGRDDLIALLVLHGEENLLADVLKEQEAIKPKWFIDAHHPSGAFRCGACGERIVEKNIDFYCSKCGQAVKWE